MRHITLWTAAALLFTGCPELEKKALENTPPIASVTISPTGVVGARERVNLDGSASADPEGRALTFKWTQVAGDPVDLEGSDGPVATFTAPSRPQAVIFTLTVSDGRYESVAYARVEVDFNTRPRALAPQSSEVPAGTQVLLSGQGEDPDGDEIVSYEWKVEAAPAAAAVPVAYELSGATSANAVLRPILKGLYSVSLAVTDSRGKTSLPNVFVVKALNTPPKANAGTSQEVLNGQPIVLTGTGTDSDPTDVLSYRWVLEPPAPALPLLSGGDTAQLSVTPAAKGVYTFALYVSDGEAESPPSRVLLSSKNNAPVVTPAPLQVRNQSALSLTAPTSDADQDPVTLSWTHVSGPGAYALTQTGTGAQFIPQAKGVYTLRVTPHDGTVSGMPQDVQVTALNQAPVAAASSNRAAVSTGETFTLSAAQSSDPDRDVALTYAWTQTQGAAVTANGGWTGQTLSVAAGGTKETLRFEVVVRDEENAASSPASVNVLVDNTAPVAVASMPQFVGAGDVVQLSGSGNDLESSSLLYKWRAISPANLAFMPSDTVANPTITAPANDGATLAVELVVSDGRTSSAPVTVQAGIVPGDGANVFVNAGATCGTTCDGTRAKPFTSLAAGVNATSLLPVPKPLLVAAGTYSPISVLPGISISGGRDPVRFLPGGGETVIQAPAGSSEPALLLDGAGTRVSTIDRLTLRGSTGNSVPGTADLTALHCRGCKANFDSLLIEAQGSTTAGHSTRGILIDANSGPVSLKNSEIVGGVGQNNVAVYVANSTDVQIVGNIIRTRPSIRLTGVSGNRNLTLDGTGGNVVVANNRIIAEGNATATYSNAVMHTGTIGAVVASNFIWYRATANGHDFCCGETFAQSALLMETCSMGGVTFLNNTLLGNDTAYNNGNPLYSALMIYKYGSPSCPYGGLTYLTNNYAERFRAFVYRANHLQQIRLRSNTIRNVEAPVCDAAAGGCTTNPDDMNLSSSFLASGGSGNNAGDCKVQSFALGDFHLPADGGSPCVDTGISDPFLPANDLDGQPRLSRGAVDRGADEVP